MNKKIIFVALFMMSLFTLNAQRAAVMEFKAGVGISQADVDGISGIFTTYFRPSGYTMVERTQIDRVIDEQGFQRSRLTESQMVRIGQILNVSKIVIGDVNIVMGQYNVDVRVINVESGTIAATEGATFSGSSYRTSMQNVAQKLASKIAIGAGPTVSGSSSSNATPKSRTQVETVYGYLHVFPNELGVFQSEPTMVINQINTQGMYGYNKWRIPTNEELALLRASGYLREDKYMSKEEPSGCVLLVAIGKSIAEINSTSENGYEWEDLGLSVKWATCNVGAKTPEEYGSYFAWGETSNGSSGRWSGYLFCECAKEERTNVYTGDYIIEYNLKTLKKYNTSSYYGNVDNKTTLEFEDDAARKNMGGTWRMPTDAEFLELKEKCFWQWTTDYNNTGVKGYIVTSKINGKSVFFPIAGYYSSYLRDGGYKYLNGGALKYSLKIEETCYPKGNGNYWSSSLTKKDPERAFSFYLSSNDVKVNTSFRCCSLSIRAVCP